MQDEKTSEQRAIRLKRLAMRSRRRGIREMDLVLGAYADSRLETMTSQELNDYESLLGENDQDLHAWVTGAAEVPLNLSVQVSKIVDFLAEPGLKPFN